MQAYSISYSNGKISKTYEASGESTKKTFEKLSAEQETNQNAVQPKRFPTTWDFCPKTTFSNNLIV